MVLKRERDHTFGDDNIHSYHRIESSLDMANCLMLLSKVGETDSDVTTDVYTQKLESSPSSERVFACKTCNRTFPSFQALGGHRASHKKPKLSDAENQGIPQPPPKPKTHECSICGLEFAIGQALGGHMRRHRQSAADSGREQHAPAPVLMKSNSCKRVCVDLDLDLHLAPPGNYYDLKVQFKAPPTLECFI